ncbi:cdc42 effector protein 4-like [Clarias gariepinus]|uniref:cdc42 effector protein 4-like n=1 Tax=Clarias gariepinus TaxID=13013 RepID=UPI00234DA325|nr:cdc42 effector protein 4-like [Clarias gariepinus]
MPILKRLVSGSSGSKRRSRSDLTVEMISAPLTDFRHTMHIGRGGDAFGDTSFLSTPCESASQGHKNGFLPRRSRGSRRSQSERNSSAMSYILPANSALSLPYASEDRNVTRSIPKSSSLNFTETNEKTEVMDGRSLEMEERRFGEPCDLPVFTPPSGGGMKHAESMLSFHIDLGPSMLGDVLGVMDQTERGLTEEQRGAKPRLPISVFTSSPGVKEEKTPKGRESETRSPTYSVNINDSDFLFMDEDEDEIRM